MVMSVRGSVVALFGMFAVGAAGCGGEAGDQTESFAGEAVGSALSAAPTQRAARFEVRFMTDMIDHHQMAVMMAEMCLEKAVHEELRVTCENIVTAQTAEIDTMQGWLQDWYEISYEPEMKKGTERIMDRHEALTPEEFEIEFMDMMIRHHSRAVREGEKCLEKAYHAELIDLCENIIETQTVEIEQMEAWLCQWYERC